MRDDGGAVIYYIEYLLSVPLPRPLLLRLPPILPACPASCLLYRPGAGVLIILAWREGGGRLSGRWGVQRVRIAGLYLINAVFFVFCSHVGTAMGAIMWAWILWRAKHDLPVVLVRVPLRFRRLPRPQRDCWGVLDLRAAIPSFSASSSAHKFLQPQLLIFILFYLHESVVRSHDRAGATRGTTTTTATAATTSFSHS